MRYQLLLAAGLAAGLAGLAQANVTYDCGVTEGIAVSATLFDEEDVVRIDARLVATGETRSITLPPAVTGSGFRYALAQPPVEFFGQGSSNATMIDGSTGLQVSCAVTGASQPGGGTAQPGGGAGPDILGGDGFAGFSFGGNLRDGPGTQFRDIGSTFNGQPLTLLSDSGIYYNGYSFWVVVLQNGQEAYQWGGIICAPGFDLPGVFNDGC